MEKSYTGVTWNRQKQRWVSKIICNGITFDCGFYTNQISAVKARDSCIIRNGLGLDKLQILKQK